MKTLYSVLAVLFCATVSARLMNEAKLKATGANFDKLHTNMMKHVRNAEEMKEQALLRNSHAIESTTTDKYRDIMLGFVEGMTFGEEASCNAGLYNMIYHGFSALDHISIYIPDNTIKFPIALTELQSASNTVFAYCDFQHLYDTITKLATSTDLTSYGALAGRLSGMMVGEFWTSYACIQDGMAGQNYYDVGYCSGMLGSIVLDTQL